MEVKFNDNGTATVKQMPMALFDAIQELLWKAQNGEWREQDGKYKNEVGIRCEMDKEQMTVLDNINWTL